MRTRMVAAVTVLGLLGGPSSVVAAPPPTNPQTQVIDWACDDGMHFSTVTIEQNNALASQVVEGSDARVFITTRFTRDGEELFDVPGLAGKATVTSCVGTNQSPGVLVDGLFAPPR